ncbi:MAG: hypothetical protein IPK13_11875 [Deltaproteobacteria bacterium]|nr:hypothetical protein [Deltaproteobacteria bacterium]
MLTLASVAEKKDEPAFQDPAVEESFKLFADKCRQPGLGGIWVAHVCRPPAATLTALI